MNTEIAQEEKGRLRWLEKQLRSAGQRLDSLWREARTVTGQARTEIHNKIGSLRKKQNIDRIEHERSKIDGRRSNQSSINKGTENGNSDEDLTAGPKE